MLKTNIIKYLSNTIHPSVPSTYHMNSQLYIKSKLCTETNNIEIQCWKCSKTVSMKKLFCKYCNSLQKPSSDIKNNYYDLFDMKLQYSINNNNLSKKYKYLQTQLHPDKFSNKEQEEQSISETYSSIINKAYSVLQNPLERGLYLLSLENIRIDEDTHGTDQKLLMEIMMLNEEMDDASSVEELDTLHLQVKDTISDLIEKINESFNQKQLDEAKELLIKMKYFTSVEKKIKEKRNGLQLKQHT